MAETPKKVEASITAMREMLGKIEKIAQVSGITVGDGNMLVDVLGQVCLNTHVMLQWTKF